MEFSSTVKPGLAAIERDFYALNLVAYAIVGVPSCMYDPSLQRLKAFFRLVQV